MNDTIHVEVQIVELDAVGIGIADIHRDLHIAHNVCLLFDAVHYNFGVPAARRSRVSWCATGSADVDANCFECGAPAAQLACIG